MQSLCRFRRAFSPKPTPTPHSSGVGENFITKIVFMKDQQARDQASIQSDQTHHYLRSKIEVTKFKKTYVPCIVSQKHAHDKFKKHCWARVITKDAYKPEWILSKTQKTSYCVRSNRCRGNATVTLQASQNIMQRHQDRAKARTAENKQLRAAMRHMKKVADQKAASGQKQIYDLSALTSALSHQTSSPDFLRAREPQSLRARYCVSQEEI